MKNITEKFCIVDDFGKKFGYERSYSGRKPTRTPGLYNSEIVSILIMYYSSGYKTLKDFYLKAMPGYKSDFPKMPTYERFVELLKRVKNFFMSFLESLLETDEHCYFIDSTEIPVSRLVRASRNKVFKNVAKLGKSSKGFFFGFKLHAIINRRGSLSALNLSTGNIDDRKPVAQMTNGLTGLLVGDKGYISKNLFQKLFEKGIKLVTNIKKGMKSSIRSAQESLSINKRFIIETVFSILKGRLDLVHSRHRSKENFLVHILAVLTTYQLRPNKPSVAA